MEQVLRAALAPGRIRRLFDLHRSGGVWTWLLVGVVAVTSVSMNLGTEVVRPLVNAISPLSPSPFDARNPDAAPRERVARAAVLRTAVASAAERGVVSPAGDLFMQAQFPLHSGRIAGVPGRILVSILGLVVAGHSITRVMIWARKRAARRSVARFRASSDIGGEDAYTTETMSP